MHIYLYTAVCIYLLVIVQVVHQKFVQTNRLHIRKLPVLNLAQKQQRLVQTSQVLQCAVGFHQLRKLLLGQGIILHQHLQAVATDGQRSLHLMRGIPDKEFLLLIKLLTAFGEQIGRFIQFPEFHNPQRLVERFPFASQPIVLQPFQQSVQRTHIAIEHPGIDGQNHQQQKYIQKDNPSQNGSLKIVFFNGRRVNHQLHIAPVILLENGHQDAGRFSLTFCRNVHHFIPIGNFRIRSRIFCTHVIEEILVVRTVARVRHLFTRQ